MSVEYKGEEYSVKKKGRGETSRITLDLSGKGITDISEIRGLETLTNLHVLKLNNNNIVEIKGLETVGNLIQLELRNNQITEIKGLDNLVYLEELDLQGNKIEIIKGLDTLKNLRDLNLFGNKISQVKSFSKKEHLRNLWFSENPIYFQLKFIPGNSKTERLENYAQMSKKEIEEAVENGMAENGSVLYHGREYKATMKDSLLTLDLSSWGIKDISEIKGLENLTKLQALNLNVNNISEIKGLETLINLETLLLENNRIETLKGLDNLGYLKTLNLYNCRIHQIESFKNKDYLKFLILGKNPLYRDLKFAISKKKKLSRMTEEERKEIGVNPAVWEIARSISGKLLNLPQKNKKSSSNWDLPCCCQIIIGIIALLYILLTNIGKI